MTGKVIRVASTFSSTKVEYSLAFLPVTLPNIGPLTRGFALVSTMEPK